MSTKVSHNGTDPKQTSGKHRKHTSDYLRWPIWPSRNVAIIGGEAQWHQRICFIEVVWFCALNPNSGPEKQIKRQFSARSMAEIGWKLAGL